MKPSQVAAVFFLLLLAACATTRLNEAPLVKGPSVSEIFSNADGSPVDGCFLLYDLKNERFIEEFGGERCRQELPACSTFKVPLAVMGFDSGELPNKTRITKWDGQKRMLPAWNKDQNAESWMRESTVWYSQRLTTKLGAKKVQSYLTKFDYGNHDFSGGLTDAWLTPAPFLENPPKPTLMISAYQQIDFLKKLWKSELPVTKRSMQLTREIMLLEETPDGSSLSGKTGSGLVGPELNLRLAWFVAHVKRGENEYLAVSTFTDRQAVPGASYGGATAKEMMKQALASRGL